MRFFDVPIKVLSNSICLVLEVHTKQWIRALSAILLKMWVHVPSAKIHTATRAPCTHVVVARKKCARRVQDQADLYLYLVSACFCVTCAVTNKTT